MDNYNNRIRFYVLTLIIFTTLCKNVIPTYASVLLSKEEKIYIEENPLIKVATIEGEAPIVYINKKGKVDGIGKLIFDEISKMTGLVFEYDIFDSLEDILSSDADVFFGTSKPSTIDNSRMSNAFLESETILFINSKTNFKEIDNIKYATRSIDKLPHGIKDENVIYFQTIEECLDAVESGKADYAYGNSYSLAFYTLQNGYQNLITIPKGYTSRKYCMEVPENNDLLLSIINKSIDHLGENGIRNIILDVTSRVDRKITFKMIMDTHGLKITAVFAFIIFLLIIEIVNHKKTNTKLNTQRKKYELLSQTDGLTGLYNAKTIRELSLTNIKNKDRNTLDAFIVMDCDKFKGINDEYGHLIGDQVLENVAKALKVTFSGDNLIGRVGGDEFCVYMNDVPSKEFLTLMCEGFNLTLQDINKDFYVSASIGSVIFQEKSQFREIFKKADDALYEAKKMGRGKVVVKEQNAT